MAKICPETNEKVLYIECIECETKTCRKGNERKEIDMQTFRKEYPIGTKETIIIRRYLRKFYKKVR